MARRENVGLLGSTRDWNLWSQVHSAQRDHWNQSNQRCWNFWFGHRYRAEPAWNVWNSRT
jgi:hypothetical protein